MHRKWPSFLCVGMLVATSAGSLPGGCSPDPTPNENQGGGNENQGGGNENQDGGEGDPGDPQPTLSGCPNGGDVAISTPFTLTISISEGTIVGVTTIQTGVNAEVAITRVDDSTFTVIVTPTEEGDGTVQLTVDFAEGIFLPVMRIDLSCSFKATDRGACCVGRSCEVTDEGECFFSGGVFRGLGTTCDPNPCLGACCNAGRCTEGLSESECTDRNGYFQGRATLCRNHQCDDFGACCIGDGTCIEVNGDIICEILAGDAGGEFVGAGQFCRDQTCEVTVGVCCLGAGECTETNLMTCQTMEGGFLGAGTNCIENSDPCLRPAGACCFNGVCQVLGEDNCNAVPGEWQGAHKPCTPGLCDE